MFLNAGLLIESVFKFYVWSKVLQRGVLKLGLLCNAGPSQGLKIQGGGRARSWGHGWDRVNCLANNWGPRRFLELTIEILRFDLYFQLAFLHERCACILSTAVSICHSLQNEVNFLNWPLKYCGLIYTCNCLSYMGGMRNFRGLSQVLIGLSSRERIYRLNFPIKSFGKLFANIPVFFLFAIIFSIVCITTLPFSPFFHFMKFVAFSKITKIVLYLLQQTLSK